VVLNFHEDSSALFNTISSISRCVIRFQYVINVREKKNPPKKQKLEPTHTYKL
jgi:hypothetical protein